MQPNGSEYGQDHSDNTTRVLHAYKFVFLFNVLRYLAELALAHALVVQEKFSVNLES